MEVSQSQRTRVLIADDDDSIRRLMSKILRRAGFETTEVADGQEAIECLSRGRFDALVLDIMMPRVDGFGVVSHLVTNASEMVGKTVVVTAFSKAATTQKLQGVCLVIAKPFEVAELVSAVQQCAGR
jgi:CheY-like chemotaxis protein